MKDDFKLLLDLLDVHDVIGHHLPHHKRILCTIDNFELVSILSHIQRPCNVFFLEHLGVFQSVGPRMLVHFRPPKSAMLRTLGSVPSASPSARGPRGSFCHVGKCHCEFTRQSRRTSRLCSVTFTVPKANRMKQVCRFVHWVDVCGPCSHLTRESGSWEHTLAIMLSQTAAFWAASGGTHACNTICQ